MTGSKSSQHGTRTFHPVIEVNVHFAINNSMMEEPPSDVYKKLKKHIIQVQLDWADEDYK